MKQDGKTLTEQLLFTQPHIADEKPETVQEAFRFCEDYKAFMDASKTEREAAQEIERRVLAAGYKAFVPGQQYDAGEKVYFVNRAKSVLCATIGQKPHPAPRSPLRNRPNGKTS